MKPKGGRRFGLAFAAVLTMAVPAKGDDAEQFSKALRQIRADGSDLSIRADRWDAPLAFPAVERLLEHPLELPKFLDCTQKAFNKARGLSDLVELAEGLAGFTSASSTGSSSPQVLGEEPALLKSLDSRLDPKISRSVQKILGAISRAQILLDQAVNSLPPEERERGLQVVRSVLIDRNSSSVRSGDFKKLAGFDRSSLLSAAKLLTRTVDAELPALEKQESSGRVFQSWRRQTAWGDVIVAGASQTEFSDEELQKSVLIIGFGSKRVYRGAPAAAGTGQIRIVIDLAPEIQVEAPDAPSSAGSGIFGIGLFYLPNPHGKKIIHSGDVSQGAGLFGVGGLFVNGSGCELSAHRFGQGAAAFGYGLLLSQGDLCSFKSRFEGQGFGFTGGIGLFSQKGEGARMKGGLYYPDPREPLALISLSQGVGYGPRAFAAGGIGLASINGDGFSAESSYMAQGMGYWHALGALFVQGDGGQLTARRYVQGTGVHTGVGAMRLAGGRNTMRAWGVSAGYGWDYGVGFLKAEGDDNRYESEWSSGHGDFNGYGLAEISGRRNRIDLADFGTGELKRDAPSYGVALWSGADSLARLAGLKPWGIAQGPGLESKKPELSKVDWPQVDRAPFLAEERARLAPLLEEAKRKAAPERLDALLGVIKSADLDSDIPAQAAQEILSLSNEQGAGLASMIDSENFDNLLWASVLLPSFGTEAAQALAKEVRSSSALKKSVLLSAMSRAPASIAVAGALGLVHDSDWRVRRAAATVLGAVFGRQAGDHAGRLKFLAECRKVCANGRFDDSFFERIGTQYLSTLYFVLSLDPILPAETRVRLLKEVSTPFDYLGPDSGEKAFAALLVERRQELEPAIGREIKDAESLDAEAHEAVLALLKDADPEVVEQALVALGGFGKGEDAPTIAQFFLSPRSLLRESAARSLAFLSSTETGADAARAEIKKALNSPSALTRALAVVAAAQSADLEIIKLIHPAFSDPDPIVRRAAISGLDVLIAPHVLPEFRNDVRRMADHDRDAALRAGAKLVLSSMEARSPSAR